jgi:hypothetical protein
MEVLDNLSHDLIRYDTETGHVLQGIAFVDESLDFTEGYEPLSDQHIKRFS